MKSLEKPGQKLGWMEHPASSRKCLSEGSHFKHRCEQSDLQKTEPRHKEDVLKGCPGSCPPPLRSPWPWFLRPGPLVRSLSFNVPGRFNPEVLKCTSLSRHLSVWDGAWLLVVGRALETAEMADSGARVIEPGLCVCVRVFITSKTFTGSALYPKREAVQPNGEMPEP